MCVRAWTVWRYVMFMITIAKLQIFEAISQI